VTLFNIIVQQTQPTVTVVLVGKREMAPRKNRKKSKPYSKQVDGGRVDLYVVLNAPKDVSAKDLRKLYHAACRRWHPDKNQGSEEAANRMQLINKAYEILKDAEKRKRYDRTGSLDDETNDFWDLYHRYRGPGVTEADIESDAKAYRGSEEEKADILRFFDDREGDCSGLLAHIIHSCDEDIARFQEILQKAGKKPVKPILLLKELGAEDIEEAEDNEDQGFEEEENDEEMRDFIAPDDEEEGSDEDAVEEKNPGLDLPIFKKGEKIEARWRKGSRWYPGFITKVHMDEREFDIKYEDDAKEEQNVAESFIRAHGVPKEKASFKKRKAAPDVPSGLEAAILGKQTKRNKNFDEWAKKYG